MHVDRSNATLIVDLMGRSNNVDLNNMIVITPFLPIIGSAKIETVLEKMRLARKAANNNKTTILFQMA